MAGIYIPNTKMPEECHYCPIRDSCEESVPLSHRPPDCQLVEVPDHGRLIDADKFEYEVDRRRESGYMSLGTQRQFKYLLEISPTIIPADKETET